jgi:hypothetical protein
LDKRRNPTRLVAQGVLGISGLGEGGEECLKMVIKIGLTERPGVSGVNYLVRSATMILAGL